MDEAAVLPITRGYVVHRANSGNMTASDALPARCPFPGSSPVIGQRPSDDFRSSPGWVGPPQFPLSPSERSAPSTPGGSSGPYSRFFTPSMAFALNCGTRLLLFPTRRMGRLTTRQVSLHATDRSVAPPYGASDAGLRPDPFPGQAASLLPGLLAVTRTGLSPAGDSELLGAPTYFL
jgi:hypothetical protein